MKKAFVTGGSRGIGAESVRALVRDGYRVYFGYNSSEDAAKALASETGAFAVRIDVSDSKSVADAFKAVGALDVLVCNAGISSFGLITDMSDDEWRRVFAVNTDGVFACCRAALPAMINAKCGSIITVSSMWGIVGASCEAAYSASKAAVIGFTKALAKEVGPSGIRVNCVAPGVIKTDMNAHLSGEALAELADSTPLGRIGTPAEVAELVSFLASDKASFITGQTIACDGGFSL